MHCLGGAFLYGAQEKFAPADEVCYNILDKVDDFVRISMKEYVEDAL